MASRFAQFAASLSKSASNLSKSAASLSNKMQGKNLAGKDAHGNLYYNDPNAPYKRWVEYRGQDLLGDTSTVPMSWYAWLRNTREEAPTPEELDLEVRTNVQRANKIKQIKEADAKLRLQEIAEQRISEGESPASVANMEEERSQRGGVSTWGGKKQ